MIKLLCLLVLLAVLIFYAWAICEISKRADKARREALGQKEDDNEIPTT